MTNTSPLISIPAKTVLKMLSFALPLLVSFAMLLPTSHTQDSVPQDLYEKKEGRPLNVLPLPTKYSTGNEVVCLSPDWSITFPGLSLDQVPEDLQLLTTKTERHLLHHKHRYLSVKRGAEFFTKENGGCKHHLSTLEIRIEHAGEGPLPSIMDSATRPTEERPDLEAYTLSVPTSGPGVIKTTTALGALRGLATFVNLFYHLPKDAGSSSAPQASASVLSKPNSLGQLPLGAGGHTDQGQEEQGSGQRSRTDGTTYAPAAPYEIEDKPAFGWRAVLLDTSRNWFGKEAIIKMLDAMVLVKLNVFHWHITDSNSWPLDLASHPELAREGAYSEEQSFSEADIQEIISHAGGRGIDVVLEIDTPGHTASIAESHPDIIACFERSPWKKYAHQPPPGQLRFASKAATDFTKAVFESTLDLVSSQYFGTGGDEINEKCMLEDEETVSALHANGWTLDDALDDFTAKTHATILGRSKTPVVWQEMVLDHGDMPGLSKDTIVDIWVNSADARRVLDKGYKIIHASGDYFYLDCGQGQWIGVEGGGNSWCDPFKSWQRMYSFDPYHNVDEGQRKQVLGGQVSLWAEQTDETNFETVLWPRAAAVAELFWTGPGENGYPRSSIEAYPRMHDTRYRMVENQGIRAGPLQPHWCALRPGVCVDVPDA